MFVLIEVFALIGFTSTLLIATFLLLALIGDIELKKIRAGAETHERDLEYGSKPVVTRLRFGQTERLFGTQAAALAPRHEFTRAS